MRLRTKLALLFTFLSLFVVGSLGYVAYHTGLLAIQQNVSDQLLDMNLLKEAEIARWITSNERSLQELAQCPLVRELTVALISNAMSDQQLLDIRTQLQTHYLLPTLRVSRGFLDLSILHPIDGQILVSTDTSLEGKYRGHKSFFVRGKSGIYTGSAIYELTTAEIVMHVSTPILDADGDLVGVLVAHADLSEMSEITKQRSGFATEEDTYLVNKFNFFVTEPAFGEGYALHRAVYTEGVALALEGGTGVAFYDDYRGTPVLGAYRWIQERELAIITEVSVRDAFALVVRLRNTIAGIGIATALAAVFLSFLFAGRITKRLQKLSSAVGEVADGNLSVRLQGLAQDEVGQLGRSFNKMAEDLQTTTASRDELAKEIAGRKRAEETIQRLAEDLSLLCLLNDVVNRGNSLQEVIQVLARETKRIFSSYGATVYLLSKDGEYLVMQNPTLPPAMENRIKKLIGMRIPTVRILLKAGSLYRKALQEGKPQLISDPTTIQSLMAEFTENKMLKKLVPKIYRVLDIRSVINVPLVLRGEAIGLLDISRKEPFTESALPRVEALSGQLTAIINRKRAEEMLEQERDRARTYLDVAAVTMIALDREGRITLVNRQGAAMLGYSEEELLGEDWFETCVPDRLRSDVHGVFERLMTDNADSVEYYENPILTRDGEERIVAWHNALLRDRGGKIIGTLSSGLDITDQKNAEQDKLAMEAHLRQSQKLESIGTLASGVAHEINNPLMGMINYADLIADEVKDDTAQKYSQIIMQEGHRIAEIIRNLLSFARQEKQTHSPAVIRDIIDSSLSLVGSLLRKDQITIEVDVPDDLPSVKCRSQQIQQVIVNLLTNAHDALNERYPEYDEKKIIRITAHLFENEREDWIRTTIEDHGAGIPKDVTKRIFDPFFTTKPRDEGTGLGLSVSFGIVREHHGELTVESVPGEFTRFHIDLRVNNG